MARLREDRQGLFEAKISGYNQAAHYSPWVVIADLNHEAACAPLLKRAWLPSPAPRMCFRIAVREIESWLLADSERISSFLKVAKAEIPNDTEALGDPKQTMVQLAGRSRSRAIQEDMVPRPGGGRREGPAYSSRLVEFVMDQERGWRPVVAARRSDSLAGCLRSLKRLVDQQHPPDLTRSVAVE